ncbi:cell envelope biogenesis protein OmpA [Bacteroidia bacterium]|nr:cell envelope biogenesis protein OmpA [Bacteroidia bacterium]
MKKLSSLLYLALAGCLVAMTLVACVPQKKYQSLREQLAYSENRDMQLNKELESTRQEQEELRKVLKKFVVQIDAMNDSINLLKNEQHSLSNSYAQLVAKQDSLRKDGEMLVRPILAQVQQDKEALQKKEDTLAATEQILNERSATISQLELNIEQQKRTLLALDSSLHAQQARMISLEGVLQQKDSIAGALKSKVSDALLNFEGRGLTIQLRNGKVYVSMDEKLMFASGSFVLDHQGAEALKNLAAILEKNPDINALIEGHTDDVPYVGAGQLADNWDLSCKRATSVVRLLLAGSTIDASRITAAGRAEFVPLQRESTPEARAANRRIEVVLSPKLDEVLKMLEN